MAYGDFKNLPRRTTSEKVLRDKAFNIAKNPKYDRYQSEIASMVCRLFDKKSSGGITKSEVMSNQWLGEELQTLIISKFEKRKVYSSFNDNIWQCRSSIYAINK